MPDKKKKPLGNISDFYLSQKTPRDRPMKPVNGLGTPPGEVMTKFELQDEDEPVMWEAGMPFAMGPRELTQTKLGDYYPQMQQWLEEHLKWKAAEMEREDPYRKLKYRLRRMYDDDDF